MIRTIMIPVSILKNETPQAPASVVCKKRPVKQRFPILILIVIHIFSAANLGAQSAVELFEKGLDAFRWQKNSEAAAWFSQAVEADPTSDEYLLYLGTCQHELGQLSSAEESYSKGLDLDGPNRDQLQHNRGELRMEQGDFEGAKADFDVLLLGDGRMVSRAMLSRGVLHQKSGYFPQAVEDYSSYLIMDPDSSQKETIEEMIGLLSAKIADDAEQARIAAEQARLAEETRLAEEARRAQEEAERAAQMEALLNSLSKSGEDTRNVGAGTENIFEDFEDTELED